MSDILGYDCDGRALRAGDRVSLVKRTECGSLDVGEAFVVADYPVIKQDDEERVSVFYGGYELGCAIPSRGLRLINSGRELFDKCASEAGKIKTGETA